uniref:Uncharacterized protein n=1 Tax=Physcomitrium patens TaxID=3218 RepID=A0A2K1IN42_PHYPA|nr:hypothetical protein PHYPA_027003 [Physcomitrium patens]
MVDAVASAAAVAPGGEATLTAFSPTRPSGSVVRKRNSTQPHQHLSSTSSREQRAGREESGEGKGNGMGMGLDSHVQPQQCDYSPRRKRQRPG